MFSSTYSIHLYNCIGKSPEQVDLASPFLSFQKSSPPSDADLQLLGTEARDLVGGVLLVLDQWEQLYGTFSVDGFGKTDLHLLYNAPRNWNSGHPAYIIPSESETPITDDYWDSPSNISNAYATATPAIREDGLCIFQLGNGTLAWISHILAHCAIQHRSVTANYAGCAGAVVEHLCDIHAATSPFASPSRIVYDQSTYADTVRGVTLVTKPWFSYPDKLEIRSRPYSTTPPLVSVCYTQAPHFDLFYAGQKYRGYMHTNRGILNAALSCLAEGSRYSNPWSPFSRYTHYKPYPELPGVGWGVVGSLCHRIATGFVWPEMTLGDYRWVSEVLGRLLSAYNAWPVDATPDSAEEFEEALGYAWNSAGVFCSLPTVSIEPQDDLYASLSLSESKSPPSYSKALFVFGWSVHGGWLQMHPLQAVGQLAEPKVLQRTTWHDIRRPWHFDSEQVPTTVKKRSIDGVTTVKEDLLYGLCGGPNGNDVFCLSRTDDSAARLTIPEEFGLPVELSCTYMPKLDLVAVFLMAQPHDIEMPHGPHPDNFRVWMNLHRPGETAFLSDWIPVPNTRAYSGFAATNDLWIENLSGSRCWLHWAGDRDREAQFQQNLAVNRWMQGEPRIFSMAIDVGCFAEWGELLHFSYPRILPPLEWSATGEATGSLSRVRLTGAQDSSPTMPLLKSTPTGQRTLLSLEGSLPGFLDNGDWVGSFAVLTKESYDNRAGWMLSSRYVPAESPCQSGGPGFVYDPNKQEAFDTRGGVVWQFCLDAGGLLKSCHRREP